MVELSEVAKLRVAVATFGRSDFSILRPLCDLLVHDERFDVGLWVGGAHFEQVSGGTIADIEASGLPIWARIDTGPSDRSMVSTVEAMAAQMTGFARAAARADALDLVVILGDRFEAVAAGLAMVPMGLPVAHISGGSITEGAIDDVFRHCLTKIAALHFCDLPEFAQRIHRMGESPERIFTTGALGLDAFRLVQQRPFEAFVEHFGFDGLQPDFALLTLHPESRTPDATEAMAAAVFDALFEAGEQVVVTYPNADPGADLIVAAIEQSQNQPNVFAVRSFGAEWFPTAMAHAGVMVGNSSGGIIEAASFCLPVVDIGDRQKGRAHGPNVVHCSRDRVEIVAALNRARSDAFRQLSQSPNIYGDGWGAERVVEVLASCKRTDLRGAKPFVDLQRDFVGELEPRP